MAKLTSQAVVDIGKRVLYQNEELRDGKPPDDALTVEGLVNKYAFHPERVAAAKPEIDALLKELPETFRKSGTNAGGWSFLNACMDRHGEQWTGEHRAMELLVCLGIAAGSASWLGKDMAGILPGGMPYFEVHPA